MLLLCFKTFEHSSRRYLHGYSNSSFSSLFKCHIPRPSELHPTWRYSSMPFPCFTLVPIFINIWHKLLVLFVGCLPQLECIFLEVRSMVCFVHCDILSTQNKTWYILNTHRIFFWWTRIICWIQNIYIQNSVNYDKKWRLVSVGNLGLQ